MVTHVRLGRRDSHESDCVGHSDGGAVWMIRRLLRRANSGPTATRLRRFAAVGVVAAGAQMALLWVFVDAVEVAYIPSAVAAIEATIVLTYVLNNAWTFQAIRNSGRVEYAVGLVKTNVVRGTAIPIQLGVLFALVEWYSLPYLLSNAVGILVSGGYRFVLDLRWTWSTSAN